MVSEINIVGNGAVCVRYECVPCVRDGRAAVWCVWSWLVWKLHHCGLHSLTCLFKLLASQPLSPLHSRSSARPCSGYSTSVSGSAALKHMALFTDTTQTSILSVLPGIKKGGKLPECRCSAEGGIMASGMYFVRGLQVWFSAWCESRLPGTVIYCPSEDALISNWKQMAMSR